MNKNYCPVSIDSISVACCGCCVLHHGRCLVSLLSLHLPQAVACEAGTGGTVTADPRVPCTGTGMGLPVAENTYPPNYPLPMPRVWVSTGTGTGTTKSTCGLPVMITSDTHSLP